LAETEIIGIQKMESLINEANELLAIFAASQITAKTNSPKYKK